MNSEPTIGVNCPRGHWNGRVPMGEKAICPICHYTWKPQSFFEDDWNFNKKLQPIADQIYGGIWSISHISRNLGALDKDRGVDVHLNLKAGLTFDIQEKFRRSKYRHYWQFTVEYKNNPITDEPGEFYHLAANYYFYAYADTKELSFTDWWIVDLNKFKEAYITGEIKEDEIRPNPYRSRASYLVFGWEKVLPYVIQKGIVGSNTLLRLDLRK